MAFNAVTCHNGEGALTTLFQSHIHLLRLDRLIVLAGGQEGVCSGHFHPPDAWFQQTWLTRENKTKEKKRDSNAASCRQSHVVWIGLERVVAHRFLILSSRESPISSLHCDSMQDLKLPDAKADPTIVLATCLTLTKRRVSVNEIVSDGIAVTMRNSGPSFGDSTWETNRQVY